MRRVPIGALLLFVLLPLFVFAMPTAKAGAASDPRYFSQTGYRVDNDAIWDYFQHRGGVNSFGYPVSRAFRFQGFTVQFFQRRIVQLDGSGHPRLLNVLDPGLMPYTVFNGATFPGIDNNAVASAPSPSDAVGVLAFVQAHAPDSYQGTAVNFHGSFANTVPFAVAFPSGGDAGLLPGFDLEMWGVPTSGVAVDPNNHSFIYLRFQRGIMMYDASCGCTQGVLLVDYLKSILTGQNLPSDLDAEARQSPLYHQYDSTQAGWVHNPALLPNSDLTNAFNPSAAATTSAPRVIVNANLFPALDQSKLKAGDIFKGQAVRFGAPEVPLSRTTFLKGVSELNTISASDTQRLGLSKEIVFSSIQDLQTYLTDPQLPGDVDYVEYDFEGIMTPASEYGNPVGSVSQFADIAHSSGKKVTFAPIAGVLNSLQTNGGLATIASKVDVVVYQGQKQLPNLGTASFASTMQSLHAAVAGTQARLAVQLWTTINGCSTMTSVFNSSRSTLDIVSIGTHDDGPGANCVLGGIQR